MFDSFNKEKPDFLKKKDKSKKGSIDRDIIKLVNEINSKNDFYTTSSCAGRIVLLEITSRKKNECSWIFAKHDKVKFDEINKIIKNYKNKKNKYEIWFKQQPLILHVACRNLEAAKIFLDLARKIFRRAGIIGLNNRKITIEIIGSEHLETIVKDKNFVADEKYLKQLVNYANKNFEENRRKSGKFLNIISKI